MAGPPEAARLGLVLIVRPTHLAGFCSALQNGWPPSDLYHALGKIFLPPFFEIFNFENLLRKRFKNMQIQLLPSLCKCYCLLVHSHRELDFEHFSFV